ncbi:hypothetical protein FAGAP_10303, partial [Fusarium agapanthi]
ARYPLLWTAPGFSLDEYSLILFPGGHDKAVRQIIDSKEVHKLMLEYFPQTKKPSNKAVGAICHGVMVLSSAKASNEKSVLHRCTTTRLPDLFDSSVYWVTRVFLGDYYRPYGAGSETWKILFATASLMIASSSMEAVVLMRKYIYHTVGRMDEKTNQQSWHA